MPETPTLLGPEGALGTSQKSRGDAVSAEIVDLHVWRREHKARQHRLVTFPVLLPTWPWGWLLPVLAEMTFELKP